MNEVLEKAKKASAAKDQLLLKTTEQKMLPCTPSRVH